VKIWEEKGGSGGREREHSLWYSGFKFDFPGMDISRGNRALISALQAVPASPKWVRGLEEVPTDLKLTREPSLTSQENAFLSPFIVLSRAPL